MVDFVLSATVECNTTENFATVIFSLVICFSPMFHLFSAITIILRPKWKSTKIVYKCHCNDHQMVAFLLRSFCFCFGRTTNLFWAWFVAHRTFVERSSVPKQYVICKWNTIENVGLGEQCLSWIWFSQFFPSKSWNWVEIFFFRWRFLYMN